MSLSWPALHARLLARSTRLDAHRAYQLLQCRENGGLPAGDIGTLLTFLHDPGDPEAKNRILRTLVAASADSEIPTTIVILALWPGLSGVRLRLRRATGDRRDNLDDELLSELALAIRTLELSRVERVAATLLMNLERDLRRRFGGEAKVTAGPFPVEELVDGLGAAPLFTCGNGQAAGRALLARDVQLCLGDDADLVLRVAVDGETQAEAAAALGITHDAARKRYQRAIARLKETWVP
ncbi:sigma-70 family RNA polymerase sigma factor [Silicimonas algicola]|uniref:RNA polymerase sigma-70 factor (ECF subfamily) n=1 Tax=Silicimonas algicola TaxID=1826607 RepID=A0A316FSD3_9RHOB|nr:sigma-70 family RNA polymerase sigma factor [Silicimonas algicola]AZQ67645.1 sigma-70 family RNA polymerase sigma factor [Silicimonas algicola]PWK51681.1 RNA polymerase sigma-70 factor (ECF subfamily) [Silicimonas algicola]